MIRRRPTLLAMANLSTAALFLHFVNSGAEALRDWGEATFAQAARELAAAPSDDRLSPTYWDRPYFNKHPVILWSAAGPFRLFGDHSPQGCT